MDIIESIVSYLFIFIVFYLLIILMYKIFVLRSEEKINKFLMSSEAIYLKSAYKIKLTNYDSKFLVKKMIMTNAIIMSLTVTLGLLSSRISINLIISFIMLIPLMLVSYHVLAKYLIKKGSKR